MCEIKEKLIARGVPYSEVMERFVDDEDFYFDYLHQFAQDNQIKQLELAIKNRKKEEAFQAAHTLKGLMGNLGLTFLVEKILPLVECLRTTSPNGTEELFLSFRTEYQEFCKFIEENVPVKQ